MPEMMEVAQAPLQKTNPFSDLSHFIGKKVDEISSHLADQGIIDNRAYLANGRPNITNEKEARAYLDKLMADTELNNRYTDPKGSAPDKLYANQRLDFLSKVEGKRYKAYDDVTGRDVLSSKAVKGNRTVGIGFNLERKDAKNLIQAVGVQDFDGVYSGKVQLTEKQAIDLFNATIEEAERAVDSKLGDVALTRNQRLALVSLAFNNPSLLGPNVIGYIKQGKLREAANEIQYKSNLKKIAGLQTRRVAEANLFKGSLNTENIV